MIWGHPNTVPDDYLLVVCKHEFSIFVKYEDVDYTDDGILVVKAYFVKHNNRATKWKAKKALKKFFMDTLREYMDTNKS